MWELYFSVQISLNTNITPTHVLALLCTAINILWLWWHWHKNVHFCTKKFLSKLAKLCPVSTLQLKLACNHYNYTECIQRHLTLITNHVTRRLLSVTRGCHGDARWNGARGGVPLSAATLTHNTTPHLNQCCQPCNWHVRDTSPHLSQSRHRWKYPHNINTTCAMSSFVKLRWEISVLEIRLPQKTCCKAPLLVLCVECQTVRINDNSLIRKCF